MEGFEFPTIFIPTDPAVTLDFFEGRYSPKIIARWTTVFHHADYTRKVIITENNFFNDDVPWGYKTSLLIKGDP
jgi:hypothetical protein